MRGAMIALAALVIAPAAARAEIYGVKAHNVAEGGPLPVVLYGFGDDGTSLVLLGEPSLMGAPVSIDGLALSPKHGLVAFQQVAGDSRLVRVEPATAHVTVLGPILGGRVVRGATFEGPDRLWAIDVVGPELVEVNPADGRVLRAFAFGVTDVADTDIAADGRGHLLFTVFDRGLWATAFYEFDTVAGVARRVHVDGDTLPWDRYPIAVGGLAFSETTGPDLLFAFDADDKDDVLSYGLPLGQGARQVLHRDVHASFNAGNVDMAGYIAPLPTATPTALPTTTPSPTATLTPTGTPTPTRTATPYPPCAPVDRPSDIVLVVDRSSSMAADDKIEGAKAALDLFISEAQAPPDQLALVTFADTAGTLEPLTADKTRLRAAVQSIVLGQGTRIDLGLAKAREELAGPRHDPGHTPAIVLLTDGLQTGVEVAAIRAEAAAAKAAGTVLVTIGLGSGVDEALLREIATTPDRYHFAPTAADLQIIYRGLVVTVPCSSIAGVVFDDRNRDGIYTPGTDVTVADVPVLLAGPVARAATTRRAPSVGYEFSDLPGGAYVVSLDLAHLPAGLTPTTAVMVPVALGAAPVQGIDFGAVMTALPTASHTVPGPTMSVTPRPTPIAGAARRYLPLLPNRRG